MNCMSELVKFKIRFNFSLPKITKDGFLWLFPSPGKNPRKIPFDWKNWEDRKIKNFPKMKRILSQDNLATYNVTY